MNAPALRNFTAWDYAADIMSQLNDWLKENPAVVNEEVYREGARLSQLAGKTLKDVDDERKRELAPFALETGKINHRYKERTEPFNAILGVLTERLTAFAKAEEERRADEARAKAKAADEAAERAREAIARSVEAEADAAAGVVGVDVLAAVAEEQDAVAAAVKADRERQRAERDTVLRVRSPGERAVSMRNKTEYTVTDAVAALQEMGSNEAIDDEIIKRAKVWRKLHDRLPVGIVSHINRSL